MTTWGAATGSAAPCSGDGAASAKQRVHVRLVDIPWASSDESATNLGNVRSRHFRELRCISGTVLRASAVQLLTTTRFYTCKRCKHR